MGSSIGPASWRCFCANACAFALSVWHFIVFGYIHRLRRNKSGAYCHTRLSRSEAVPPHPKNKWRNGRPTSSAAHNDWEKLAQKKTFSLSQNNRPHKVEIAHITHIYESDNHKSHFRFHFSIAYMGPCNCALSTAFECHSTAGTCMTAAAWEKAASFRRQLWDRIV